jgi:hypothetical protein
MALLRLFFLPSRTLARLALALALAALVSTGAASAQQTERAGQATRAISISETSTLCASASMWTERPLGALRYERVGDRLVVLPVLTDGAASYLTLRPASADTVHAAFGSAARLRPSNSVQVSRAAFEPARGVDNSARDVPRYLLLHHLDGIAETAHALEVAYGSETYGESNPHAFARALRDVNEQARYATEIARTLPLLELQGYLTDVRERDSHLYERIVSEQALEERIDRLAAEVSAMPAGAERSAREAELRQMLSQLFDIKQENRRDEAAQLQERLEQLNQRLDARERLRERLIERRLRKLTTRE